MVDGAVPVRRRWLPAAGLAGVGLLFAYVLTHRVEPAAVEPAASGPPAVVGALDGPRGVGPQGLRVLLGGAAPATLDAHTGTVTPLPGLTVGSGERALLAPVPGGVLATVGGDRSNRAVLLRDGSAAELGDALHAQPLRDGGVALVTQGNGETRVRVRAADGTTTPPWKIRGLAQPLRDTAGGLLLSRVLSTGSSADELLLVDPRTGRQLRRLPSGLAVAVTDRLVVTVDAGCARNCRPLLTDVTTGKDRRLPAVTGAAPAGGALSPDGELLALSLPAGEIGGDAPQAGSVRVLDLVSERAWALPGVRAGSGQPAGVAWSPDGGLLVVAVPRGDSALVGLWSPDRPGSPPVVLPASPRSDSIDALTALAG